MADTPTTAREVFDSFEASFQGVHSIAFSEHAIDLHEVADRYLDEIMDELIELPLEEIR